MENNYFTGFDVDPSAAPGLDSFENEDPVGGDFPRRRAVRIEGTRGWMRLSPYFPIPTDQARPWKLSCLEIPNFQNEHVLAYEAGFRMQPDTRLSVDISTFYNRYDNLETLEPGAQIIQPLPAPARFLVPITFGNLMHGTTEGGEISANFKLTDRWTLSPGYAFLEMHLHVQPSSQDTTSVAEYQGSSPQHQAQLHSHVELPHGLFWDTDAYFVSKLATQGVPSYTRLDTQLRWRFTEFGELSVVGQNLLRDTHLESMDQLTLVNSSLIKRSAYAKFTYRFW